MYLFIYFAVLPLSVYSMNKNHELFIGIDSEQRYRLFSRNSLLHVELCSETFMILSYGVAMANIDIKLGP